MKSNRIGMKVITMVLTVGFLSGTCGFAQAKYVKPDPIQIVQNIEIKRQEAAKAGELERVTANYNEIMERLITIAAEKYGIIFIVYNSEDFFSSKEG